MKIPTNVPDSKRDVAAATSDDNEKIDVQVVTTGGDDQNEMDYKHKLSAQAVHSKTHLAMPNEDSSLLPPADSTYALDTSRQCCCNSKIPYVAAAAKAHPSSAHSHSITGSAIR